MRTPGASPSTPRRWRSDTEILGFPRVELCGSTDAAPLHWFARLSDVAPDGTVTLVTGAGRAGEPDPLRDPAVPGREVAPAAADGQAAAGEAAAGEAAAGEAAAGEAIAGEAAAGGALPLELHVTSWVFPRGHRIRLAVSNAMWPMIWPTPSPATAELRLGPAGTRLVLPVIPAAECPWPFRDPSPGVPRARVPRARAGGASGGGPALG